ncbi:PhzF family phenazine biosynthesis protein [Palleronia caenipelagi]|uniref:PhzF family phenazine biosynthesis protein n=1 Tax=Palleronia caenipelagi TaxID=2489174 RepID=A0A547PM29_9RHOB|nr:PhzF family phenazine biosynthesis protein [Palleronia caenipelagi]TRD15166.1 PhzF family phenazine biosynthesis protein [Palleronia caenipelagi]
MPEFLVYDVFTADRYAGNPLGVLPDAIAVPEDRMLPIAREFGFSETVFVYPPETRDGTHRLRIFTPTQEIPFAGHPVIGTAIALAQGTDCELRFELGIGTVPVTVRDGEATVTRETQIELFGHPETTLIAECLGLRRMAINMRSHGPIIASAGLPFALVELQDRERLAQAAPQIYAFRKAQATHELPLDFAVYAYVRDGNSVQARMFAPLDDIPEDPATGSAAAALGLYLAQIENGPVSLDITQGVEMGRPSRIRVEARPGEVRISGGAVRVLTGQITV